MNSFLYLKSSVLFFQLSLVGSAQDISTTSTPSKIDSSLNVNVLDHTKASAICKLQIYKPTVENILRYMQKHTTHVVVISVYINSKNETRIFPELVCPWANEIGRTIISLKAQPGGVFSSLRGTTISSLHYITLNPGIEKVDVVVYELNYGCLPEGSSGSELVFDFLLHQLSGSDNTHDYKLCRIFSEEDEINQSYNCCKVAGGENVTICGEYSSIVLEHGENYINVMTSIILYIGLPLIYHFLRSIKVDEPFYDITDNPMALSTIFYTAFLEGSKNPVISHSRRFTFSLLVAGILCLSYTGWHWIIASVVWCCLFTFYDFLGINDAAEFDRIYNYKTYLETLTLPFNIKYWGKMLEGNNCSATGPVAKFLAVFCFVILYLVLFVPFCIAVFSFSPGTILIIISYEQVKHKKYLIFIFFLFRLFILAMFLAFTILSFSAFLNLMLYWITGLYLNGSFYGSFFVPLLTFLVYSWKNWRSSVERKYFALLTKVYKACKKFRKNWNQEQRSEEDTNRGNGQNEEENIEDKDVNVKDGKVAKVLYDKIRAIILPYHIVLFHFLVRMFLVVNFSLIVFVMLLLAQKSNITVPAQIISAMVVTTLPLILSVMWTDHSEEQKKVDAEKLEIELENIIEMKMRTDNIVSVELRATDEVQGQDENNRIDRITEDIWPQYEDTEASSLQEPLLP